MKSLLIYHEVIIRKGSNVFLDDLIKSHFINKLYPEAMIAGFTFVANYSGVLIRLDRFRVTSRVS